MERLTMVGTGGGISEKTGVTREMLRARLAAYEDTELGPEDCMAYSDVLELRMYRCIGSIPELRAMKEAQDERRVVALPCKVGDTLYTESPIRGMVTPFKAPDLAWIIENISEFGKTVFLTRAEAEAAKGGGGDG